MKHQIVPSLRRCSVSALRQFASDLEKAREADARELAVRELIQNNPLVDRAQAHRLLAVVSAQCTQSRQELRKLLSTIAWKRRLAQLKLASHVPMIIAPSKISLVLIRGVLARRQRRLRRVLRHIGRNPRKLHRLRLRIKASRYLDEDFGSLMTRSPDRELKCLRQLQNRLGEYHDNWRLKKWLRTQAANQPIEPNLRTSVIAHQSQLLKKIRRLSKSLRKQTNR